MLLCVRSTKLFCHWYLLCVRPGFGYSFRTLLLPAVSTQTRAAHCFSHSAGDFLCSLSPPLPSVLVSFGWKKVLLANLLWWHSPAGAEHLPSLRNCCTGNLGCPWPGAASRAHSEPSPARHCWALPGPAFHELMMKGLMQADFLLRLADKAVKEYATYRSGLLFWALVDLIYNMFKVRAALQSLCSSSSSAFSPEQLHEFEIEIKI